MELWEIAFAIAFILSLIVASYALGLHQGAQDEQDRQNDRHNQLFPEPNEVVKEALRKMSEQPGFIDGAIVQEATVVRRIGVDVDGDEVWGSR